MPENNNKESVEDSHQGLLCNAIPSIPPASPGYQLASRSLYDTAFIDLETSSLEQNENVSHSLSEEPSLELVFNNMDKPFNRRLSEV